jgi:hypothetical protein
MMAAPAAGLGRLLHSTEATIAPNGLAFDLFIEFSGLCFINPPTQPSSVAMYVLMPRAGQGTPGDFGGQIFDTHKAALYVDNQYASDPSGQVHGSKGYYRSYSLDRWQLTLQTTGCAAGNPGAVTTAGINNLYQTVPGLALTLPSLYQLIPAPPPFLASCLALPCGQFVTAPSADKYALNNAPFQTSSKAQWTIPQITSLSMTLTNYDTEQTLTIPPLAPTQPDPKNKPGYHTLCLKIYNVMRGEEPGTSATFDQCDPHLLRHFIAYYDLFANYPCPKNQPWVPTYQGTSCKGNNGASGTGPYSCMLTGGGG